MSNVDNTTSMSSNNKQVTLPAGWIKGSENADISINSKGETKGNSKEHKKIKNPPATFKFKKRGKLVAKEILEIRRTHASMFIWLEKNNPPMQDAQQEEYEMEWDNMDREEKLVRVERKQREWASTRLCRSTLMDVLDDAVKMVEERHVVEMVASMVDEAWTRLEVCRVIDEITRSEENIQKRVEKILWDRRCEDEELLITLRRYEEKRKRLERVEVIKKIESKKIIAMKLRKMLMMLRRISLEDIDMEVEEIEILAMEMMEIENDELSEGEIHIENSGGNFIANICSNVDQPQTITFLGVDTHQLNQLGVLNNGSGCKRKRESYGEVRLNTNSKKRRGLGD